MTLGTAAILLVFATGGIIGICLQSRKALRSVLLVLLSLFALALIVYIALTLLFVTAASRK